MLTVKIFTKTLIFLWLLLSAAVPGYGKLADRIVAIVNDDVITLSELNEALEPYVRKIHYAAYEPEEERRVLSRLRQDVLRRMIDQTLTDQETKRLGVTVRESEVDQRIEQIKSEHFYTEEELKEVLAAEGYSLDEYRKRIKEQMLRIKLINMEVKSKIAITEDEIRDYYENHQDTYGQEKKYHLRSLLVRVPSWEATEVTEKALQKVERIVDKLEAGAAFEELAKQYSEGPAAKEGGDLGFFSIDELSPEFQETVRWMEEGDISPALKSPQGYQLIMLEEIKYIPGKTLREARIEIQEKIYREVVEEKYKEWLRALRKRSYIKTIQ